MVKSQPERLLESVGVLLQVFTVNEERFPSAEGRIRYNPIDFQALRFIHAQPGARGIDVADALSVAPTTLQSSIDRLIRSSLVERQDHPTSKRSKAYFLTPEGEDVREAIHRQDISNMQTVLDALTKPEQKTVIALLEKVAVQLSHKP